MTSTPYGLFDAEIRFNCRCLIVLTIFKGPMQKKKKKKIHLFNDSGLINTKFILFRRIAVILFKP